MQPQPNGNAAPQPLPGWALVEPSAVEQGVIPPAYGIDFQVGLTDPDKNGHQWAMVTFTDGTVTSSARIPAMVAGPLGVAIARGLDAVHQRWAQANRSNQLIVPQGAGGLIVPGR